MAYWLQFHTDSDVPIWDTIVSAFTWADMWLMAKRKNENLIYLNINNVIAIPLLFYKELCVYASQPIFLFIVGVSGYMKCRKIFKNKVKEQYTAA